MNDRLAGNVKVATHPVFPFGSLMLYGLDGQECPIFLISTMAMHPESASRAGDAVLDDYL
jgi:hypothetical protein